MTKYTPTYDVRISDGQSLLDLALQEGGTTEHLIEMLEVNPDLNLLTGLVSFTSLNFLPQQNSIAKYLKSKDLTINTGHGKGNGQGASGHYDNNHYNNQHYK